MNTNESQVIGFGVLGLGLVFLFTQVVGFSMMSLLWPLWVIVPGLAFLYFAFKDEHAHLGFAIPGTVIAGTGLILAFMNILGHWEAWSYAWAFYPVFVGVAFLKVGQRNTHLSFEKTGNRLMRIGLYLFIGFGLFFEALIFGGLSGLAVPAVLIGVGAYLVFSKTMPFDSPIKQKRKIKI